MKMTRLQTATLWQKQLDKKVAEISYEDAYSFVQYNPQRRVHEICLHGDTNATVVGFGSQKSCQRVAEKILKNPQYLKNFKN